MSSDDSSFIAHESECECSDCCDSINSVDDHHEALAITIANAFEMIAEDFGYELDEADAEMLEDELIELFYRYVKTK